MARKPNCCIKCHFSWEESELAGTLPAELLYWLQVAHAHLLKNGLQPAAIARHAREEERLLRPYLSAEQWAAMRADHVKLASGDAH